MQGDIKAKIVGERAAKKAKARADELYAALGKGETLEQVATANKLKVESQQGIGRDAANLDSALVKAAFALPRPQEGKPQIQLVELGGDAYALLQLDSVTDGDPSKLDIKTLQDAYDNVATLGLLVGGTYYDESWTVLTLLMMSGNYLDYTALTPS